MSDEPREPDAGPGEEGDDAQAPPPATWAGRARAGGGEDPEQPRHGLTEEFDGLEAELSADLDEINTDEAGADPPDEREDPPDEFEFDDVTEDGEDEDAEDDEQPEPDEDAAAAADVPAPEAESSETVEADTPAAADAEAAREAAHAGLRARAEKSAAKRGITTGGHTPVPAVPAAAAATSSTAANGAGEPPRRRLWWRFLAASLVIVTAMATATAVSFLLFLSDIADGLNDNEAIGAARAQLEAVEGGAPQTILMLGSDKRGGTPGDPGRSDTALLLRVDPDKNFLSLMSLPRDLEVPIPGYGTDKLNAAYSYGEQEERDGGGEELAIKTITQYLDLPINHVVNIDFGGFFEAVNAIDCVYIDVDRHYFHSNEGLDPSQFYSEIDIEAGYTKLCGFLGLSYVRYRHNDNDLVRGNRQQDFIREARQRIPPRELLPFLGGGNELIDIFTANTTSDINDVPTIIEMLKTFVGVREAPVRQVSLGALADDGSVVASNQDIETAVDEFLGADLDAGEPAEPAPAPEAPAPGKPKEDASRPGDSSPSLVDATGTAQQYAREFAKFMDKRDARLPIYYPTQIVANASAAVHPESRAHQIEPPQGTKDPYHGFKFVLPLQEDFGLSYYGVTGTDWLDPPILKNPSEVRRIDGRDYLLFYERDRLRLVGWRTDQGSYWVINTITRALSEAEMLAVATSTRELDG